MQNESHVKDVKHTDEVQVYKIWICDEATRATFDSERRCLGSTHSVLCIIVLTPSHRRTFMDSVPLEFNQEETLSHSQSIDRQPQPAFYDEI